MNRDVSTSPKLLITAGPTHEPIDAVRYLGNRSSGRLGIALADEAARRGWAVTLLLGPTSLSSNHTQIRVDRFRTTADLQSLLAREAPACDALVMAAAVADYRPPPSPDEPPFDQRKLRRRGKRLTLELESTPDLLAMCAASKRDDQLFVGFALEPRDGLLESARDKLERKRVDLLVANPLETMDADQIEAWLLAKGEDRIEHTPGPIDKASFAPWLLDHIQRRLPTRAAI